MGCYINPPGMSKEDWLLLYALPLRSAPSPVDSILIDYVPVCWVDNGDFTAAGVAYSAEEQRRFSNPNDPRPKLWFYAPRVEVRKVSDLAAYETPADPGAQ